MPAGLDVRSLRIDGRLVWTAGRYIGVSLLNNLVHQSVLYLANSGWDWPGGRANLFAGLVAAGPSYLMSRAWVWQVRGRRHDVRREVLPFWALALTGLALSTLFASLAHRWFGAGLLVNTATLLAYFIVWVGKFFILDWLFRSEGAHV